MSFYRCVIRTFFLISLIFIALAPPGVAANTSGAISGTVVDAESGEPLVNIVVTAYGQNGSFEGRVRTDSDGNYRLIDLAGGGYHILLSETGHHIAQVYGGGECVIGCSFFQGSVIDVSAEQTTSGIDFSLARGGSISGVVKAADTGLPLGGHRIKVYAEGGDSVSVQSFTTLDDGSYVISGLPAGDYFVVATGAGDYIGQYFGGSPCLGWCSRPSGTPVNVAQEQTAADVDIVLTKGGAIAGVAAAEDGTPIASAQVTVLDVSGHTVGTAFTDALGHYRVGGLLNGDYYVRFAHAIAWINGSGGSGGSGVVYGGAPCLGPGCDLTFATAVEVTQGQIVDDINITMAVGGSIAGTLRDRATGRGLGNQVVEAYSWDGQLAGRARTNEHGHYKIDRLLSGSYFVAGPVDDYYHGTNYTTTTYGGPDCFGPCMLVMATVVEVLQDQKTTGIDLVSRKGGEITGVVTDADIGKPLSDVHVSAVGHKGVVSARGYTDDQGVYRITGLPSDTYSVVVAYHYTYAPQAYGDHACGGCDIVDGAGISVKAGQSISGIDFALKPKQQPDSGISGTVSAADTGLPLEHIYILIIDRNGDVVSSALTDPDGHYEVRLSPGDYYVQVQRSGEYVRERYGGGACPNYSCESVDGTLLTVAASQLVTGIDFSLSKGGVISGTVTAVDGKYLGEYGLNTPYVRIVDADGLYVAASSIDAAGNYRVSGLPAGQYFVRANYSFHFGAGYNIPRPYTGQIYGGEDCAVRCINVAPGTSVQVADGAAVSGIDFTLKRAGAISGTVSAADTGEPLAHARVEVYDGHSELLMSGVANAQGEYRLGGLPTGRYYVKAAPVVQRENSYVYLAPLPGAIDYMASLFGDLPCASLCDVTRGEPVGVTIGETTANVDVALSRGDGIDGKVVDGETGGGIAYTLLSIYDSAGTRVGAESWTDAEGNYRISGLTPGEYYLLATHIDGYENQFYGGARCSPGDCEVTSGQPITVIQGQTTAVDWMIGASPRQSQAPGAGGGPVSWQVLLMLLCWWVMNGGFYGFRQRTPSLRSPERR